VFFEKKKKKRENQKIKKPFIISKLAPFDYGIKNKAVYSSKKKK